MDSLHGVAHRTSVTGGNFYKRPALLKKMLRALERGNVAFLGPRRIGKTSCLEEIKASPGRFVSILLNLERRDSAEAWLADMLGALRQILEQPESVTALAGAKVVKLLAEISKREVPGFGGVEFAGGDKPTAWRKSADEFLCLLVATDVPVLFLFDEFPTFLKLVARKRSRDEVEAVLNWFRAAGGGSRSATCATCGRIR